MSKFIEVKGVNKSFVWKEKRVDAVQDVSFTVEEGEILTILGASGSGKSTLLRLIAGFEDADSGNIVIGETEITGPKDHLVPGYEFIKMVFQDFNLEKNLNVRDNISVVLRAYQEDYKLERIEAVLDICDLKEKQFSFPYELSGGQQQRVGIAMALANEPELLILDEPFSNLDYVLKEKLRHDLKDIVSKSGVTAIFVSHDPEDAMSVADRILIMESGRVVQMDEPEALYHNPVSEYAALFLGPANTISIEGNKHIVRPEAVVLAEEGEFDGEVTSCRFFGLHFRVRIATKIAESPLLCYSDKLLVRGEKVTFHISI